MGNFLNIFDGNLKKVPPLDLRGLSSYPIILLSVIRPVNWTGRFANVIRLSDGANLDIGYKANNVADFEAADSFAQGTSWEFNTFYDSSGNGNDQTVSGSFYAKNYGEKINGLRAITFFNPVGGASQYQNLSVSIPNVRNAARIVAFRPYNDHNADWMKMGNPTFSGVFTGCRTNSGLNTPYGTSGKNPITSPQITLMLPQTSGSSYMQNGITYTTASSLPNNAAAGYILGGAATAPTAADILVIAEFSTSLTAEDAYRATRAVKNSTKILLNSECNGTMSLSGDSITAGIVATGRPYSDCLAYQIMDGLKIPLTYFNTGDIGQGANSFATVAAAVSAGSFISGSKNYAHIFFGTNDLSGNATAADTYSALQSICSSYRATGYTKIAVCTPVVRGTGFSHGQTAAGFEAARQTLMNLIDAGEGVDFDKKIDYGRDPIMGNTASLNATYFIDLIHPTRLGCSIMKNNWDIPVLSSMLP